MSFITKHPGGNRSNGVPLIKAKKESLALSLMNIVLIIFLDHKHVNELKSYIDCFGTQL